MVVLRQMISAILGVLILAGCKDPYEPVFESKDLEPILVVEGYIDVYGPSSTYTLAFASPLAAPEASASPPSVVNSPVVNAQLRIEAEDGSAYHSQSSSTPGKYTVSHPALAIDSRYRLRIEIGGETYLSEYVDVKVSPAIDEVGWEETDAGVSIYVSTADAERDSRYYRWEFEEAWRFTTPFVSILVYDFDGARIRTRSAAERIETCFMEDASTGIHLATSDGLLQDVVDRHPIHLIPRLSDRLGWRYSILVKQRTMTREAFVYWDLLKENSENLGNLFGPMPTEIRGNIAHVGDPLKPVVGMVEAVGVSRQRIYIDFLDVSWSLAARRALGANCSTREIPKPEIHDFMYYNRHYFLLHATDDVYFVATQGCMDCRLRGKLEAPSFWEER